MAPLNRRQVRIIGGQWRSRKIGFPSRPGLRPTPDRVRETLFNWLTPVLPGARVLDLCAGSGVLGLEALSRGAGEALLLESDQEAVEALQHAIAQLAANAQVIRMDACRYLDGPVPETRGFDVVFVDPPFDSGLQLDLCELLARPGWLRSGARVYLETNKNTADIQPPPGWNILKEKRTGQVEYRLFGIV